MTPDRQDPGKHRSSGTGWVLFLSALLCLIGGGVVWRKTRPDSRFSPAAEVAVSEYLTLKSEKRIREAWLDRDELYAEVDPEFIGDEKRFRYVHLIVPPAYLLTPNGMNELQFATGLAPIDEEVPELVQPPVQMTH